jgi:peptidoglycan/xylan/chitin deacetylase (PgdA/CDA1 family)
MSKKRKSGHYCKNHPKKRSTGTCFHCGIPLCANCQILFAGKTYCAATCVPKELKALTNSDKPPSDTLLYKPLILWAAVTLALCSIVVTAWIFRKYELLKDENRALQNNRSVLLSQLSTMNDIEREPLFHDLEDSVETTTKHQQAVICKLPVKPVFKTLPPLPRNEFSFNNGSNELKMVSFTFDGGSLANISNEIIDTLQSRKVMGTMFLTGHFIKRYPEIVRRLVDQGHELGNHMLTHPHLTSYSENRIQTTLNSVSQELVYKELTGTDQLLFSTTGRHFAPLWRAPYGEYNEQLCSWARAAGYFHIGWRQGRSWSEGFDTNDWVPDSATPGFKTPEEVFTKIVTLANTKPYGINGGIILMHLGTERKNREDQVHLKLGMMIDSLRSLGYTIVPVSEMINRSGVSIPVALINSGDENRN